MMRNVNLFNANRFTSPCCRFLRLLFGSRDTEDGLWQSLPDNWMGFAPRSWSTSRSETRSMTVSESSEPLQNTSYGFGHSSNSLSLLESAGPACHIVKIEKASAESLDVNRERCENRAIIILILIAIAVAFFAVGFLIGEKGSFLKNGQGENVANKENITNPNGD